MSRIANTTRTVNGLRVLAGEERRRLLDACAFDRAQFEFDYEGRQLVPCDASYCFRFVRRRLDEQYVLVNERFASEVRKRVPGMKRMIREHG